MSQKELDESSLSTMIDTVSTAGSSGTMRKVIETMHNDTLSDTTMTTTSPNTNDWRNESSNIGRGCDRSSSSDSGGTDSRDHNSDGSSSDISVDALLVNQKELMKTACYIASSLCEAVFPDRGPTRQEEVQGGQADDGSKKRVPTSAGNHRCKDSLSAMANTYTEQSQTILSSYKQLQYRLQKSEDEKDRLKDQVVALQAALFASKNKKQERRRAAKNQFRADPPVTELSFSQTIIDVHEVEGSEKTMFSIHENDPVRLLL